MQSDQVNHGYRTAVLIVTHGRSALLSATLQSLKSSDLSGINDIVVVESGATEAQSKAECARWEGAIPINYCAIRDSRKSRALNVGLERTKADFICFLDDDVQVYENTLATYVDAAHRYGYGYFFGGPHDPEGSAPPPDWLRNVLPASAAGFFPSTNEHVSDDALFLGFNWAAFKSDIQACGGFPEYLGPNAVYQCGGEETVTQERMIIKGMHGVFLPEAQLRHYVPSSRCSYAFAMKRAYIGGITRTLIDQVEGREDQHKFPPKWRFNLLLRSGFKTAFAKLMCREERDRVADEWKHNYELGGILGYWIIYKHKLWQHRHDSSS